MRWPTPPSGGVPDESRADYTAPNRMAAGNGEESNWRSNRNTVRLMWEGSAFLEMPDVASILLQQPFIVIVPPRVTADIDLRKMARLNAIFNCLHDD